MNRRGFLASLLAAATLDPERLLWVPGQKKIFIPPAVQKVWIQSMLICSGIGDFTFVAQDGREIASIQPGDHFAMHYEHPVDLSRITVTGPASVSMYTSDQDHQFVNGKLNVDKNGRLL